MNSDCQNFAKQYQLHNSKSTNISCFVIVFGAAAMEPSSHYILSFAELWSELVQCEQSLTASVLYKTAVHLSENCSATQFYKARLQVAFMMTD